VFKSSGFGVQVLPKYAVASIRVGKAKVDLYSGADASVVKALCQALKSC
jgi:hypothetical protein